MIKYYIRIYDIQFTDGIKEYDVKNDLELEKEFDKLLNTGYELYYTKTNTWFHDIGVVHDFDIQIIFYFKRKGQKLVKIGGD